MDTQDILKLKKTLPEKYLTTSVLQWFDSVEAQQNETIEEGLILEFSDVMTHPTDTSIWKRFIESLSFLAQNENYYDKVIAPINLIQQLKLVITNKLSAPMAVSLLSPEQILQTIPKYKAKTKPYLLINPQFLFSSLILSEYNHFDDTNKLFHRVLGILIHETYHVSRGDLLLDIKHHYSSENKNEKYKEALNKMPIKFIDNEGKVSFKATDIYTLNNILMDASINTEINEYIDKCLMPDEALHQMVSKDTTLNYLINVPIDDYQLTDVFDFYREHISIINKQYAVLDYHMDDVKNLPPQSQKTSKKKQNSDDDKDRNNNNNSFDKNDLLKKHSDLTQEQTDDEKEEVIADVDNLIKTSNNNAEQETNGKAYSIEPSQGLRKKILKVMKAKSLPRFDFKVKGIIKDYNSMKRLNYNLRHIAYQKRLDMCRTQDIPLKAGFHVYMDVSGSVTDKVINNVYNILMATCKKEPCYLYLFASGMSSEPFCITKKTKYKDLAHFIQNENVGFGTQFTPLFEHIKEHCNEKHIIFSDYCFSNHEFKRDYIKSFKQTPIIHVLEDDYLYKNNYCQFLNYAKKNKKFNKILKLKDYLL